MKRILVTGAGGYIGRHVVTELLDNGAKVVAADFMTDGIDSRAQKLGMDIFSGEADVFFRFEAPDVCVHLAWKDGFVHESSAHMEYLSRHYTFLRDMLEGGLKQLVVMGTMHEVGYYEGAIDEHTPCNPVSMYGIAKDALRRSLFRLMNGHTDVTLQWLRAFYIYGDDKRNHSIFAKLIQAEEAGQETFPFTTGCNRYDFIHVNELARQIARSALQTEVSGIINCCTGVPVSLSEQVERFIQDHGFRIRLNYGAFPDRAYDSPAVWGNAEKIQQIMRQGK